MKLFGSKRDRDDSSDQHELVARQLGLAFSAKDDSRVDPIDFYLIGGGRPYGATNVLHGMLDGADVRIFDWTAQRPRDPMPEIAGFPGIGGSTIEQTAALIGLGGAVSTVLLTRGTTSASRGVPQHPTGNTQLDTRFVCHTRRPETATVLDDAAFVAAIVASPDDVSIEFTEQSLLVIGARRSPDHVPAFARTALALAAATPPMLLHA